MEVKKVQAADSSSLRPREAAVKKLTHTFPTHEPSTHLPAASHTTHHRTSHPPPTQSAPRPHPPPPPYPERPRSRPPATRRAAAAPITRCLFRPRAPDLAPYALPVRTGSHVEWTQTARLVVSTPTSSPLYGSLDDGGARRAARPKVSGTQAASAWRRGRRSPVSLTLTPLPTFFGGRNPGHFSVTAVSRGEILRPGSKSRRRPLTAT